MLDKIIRELTGKDNNEQMTSEDVLVWAKRIEVQRAQAANLKDITESQKFDEVKLAQKPNGIWKQHTQHITSSHAGIVVGIMCPTYGKMCAGCGKMGHFKKVCRSKRDHAVHEVEMEMVQGPQEEVLETVNINSVYLNRNRSLITAQLEMQVGENTLEVPYKIDTSSEGNLMPFYIKRLFKNMSEEHKAENI